MALNFSMTVFVLVDVLVVQDILYVLFNVSTCLGYNTSKKKNPEV